MISIAILLGCTYIALLLLAYFLQDQLVFHPIRGAIPNENDRFERFEVTVDQDKAIVSRGLITHPEGSSPVIVYFGGNAEDSYSWADLFLQQDLTGVLVNYRGYGENNGKPTEQNVLHDANLVLQWVGNRFPTRKIIIMGRSLGSGVASIVGSEQADGLILISPYSSLVDIGKTSSLFRWLPLNLLMRHKFNSEAYVKSLRKPILVFFSSRDRVVPSSVSRKAIAQLHTPTVIEYQMSHNEFAYSPDFWQAIREWLTSNFA